MRFLSYIYSLYLNIRLFGFTIGIRLPVLFGTSVKIYGLRKGIIKIPPPVYSGMIKLGWFEGSFNMHERLNSHLIFQDKGCMVFKGSANICNSFQMKIRDNVYIGNDFYANTGLIISCERELKIGDNVLLGWGVTVIDSDGHTIIYDNKSDKTNASRSIIIDGNCWVGAGATILKGVHLIHDTIVSAGTTLTKSNAQPYCILGNNNEVVKTFEAWHR